MFVIVEGIDRVGKSTLCNKLESLGFITLKDAFGQINSNSPALARIYRDTDEEFPAYSIGKLDTSVQYIKKLCDLGYNIVADRLHLTEIVYGTLDRDYVPSYERLFRIDRMIDEMFGNQVILVHVEPTKVSEASERAERDLKNHYGVFGDAFYDSRISHKLTTDFLHLDKAVRDIAVSTFKYDFYFASPFFRPEQVEREERLKAHLRSLGYKIFSPKEACHLTATASQEDQDKVFTENVKSIRQAVGVFAITDTKDIGTIWESGCAYSLGKPIVYYAETLGNNVFNVMLAKSGRVVCTSQDQVTKELLDKALYSGERITFEGLIE